MQITITLNGEPRALAGPVTVAGLVRALSLDGRKIAVERNQEIVPRGRYDAVEVGQGDRLEIVHFIGGG